MIMYGGSILQITPKMLTSLFLEIESRFWFRLKGNFFLNNVCSINFLTRVTVTLIFSLRYIILYRYYCNIKVCLDKKHLWEIFCTVEICKSKSSLVLYFRHIQHFKESKGDLALPHYPKLQ